MVLVAGTPELRERATALLRQMDGDTEEAVVVLKWRTDGHVANGSLLFAGIRPVEMVFAHPTTSPATSSIRLISVQLSAPINRNPTRLFQFPELVIDLMVGKIEFFAEVADGLRLLEGEE